ncbi:hypothetical protein [Desulfoplanes sp.]
MPSRDNLVRMPGSGCRFYAHGHCLYEEMKNPGYDGSRTCTVLKKAEARFDDFVDRAEAFGIEEMTAATIWPRFSNRDLVLGTCPHYLPGPDSSGGCLFLHENACILLCPMCHGRCSGFEPLAKCF